MRKGSPTNGALVTFTGWGRATNPMIPVSTREAHRPSPARQAGPRYHLLGIQLGCCWNAISIFHVIPIRDNRKSTRAEPLNITDVFSKKKEIVLSIRVIESKLCWVPSMLGPTVIDARGLARLAGWLKYTALCDTFAFFRPVCSLQSFSTVRDAGKRLAFYSCFHTQRSSSLQLAAT